MESTNMADVIEFLSSETMKVIEKARKDGFRYVIVTLADSVEENGLCSVALVSEVANNEKEIRKAIKKMGINLADPEQRDRVKIYEVI